MLKTRLPRLTIGIHSRPFPRPTAYKTRRARKCIAIMLRLGSVFIFWGNAR